MSDLIQVDVEGAVAAVFIDRPEKRNALTLEMFQALAAVADDLAARDDVRAVILAGRGEHFCAGIDVSLLGQEASEPGGAAAMLAPVAGSPANFAQRAAYAWRELPVPVICALSGTVFGAGLQVALAADVRLAGPDVRLSAMEIRWGIIPDMSLSVTLPQLVRGDVARELVYTGRIVEADEAVAMGLVTRVVDDPFAEARSAAGLIAAANPHAVRSAKRLLNGMLDGDAARLLSLEADLQGPLLGSDNQKEAVRANLAKRIPRFQDVG